MNITQKKLERDSFCKTSDFALVTTISIHFPIESVDKTHPRRVVFVFKRNKKLSQFIESYWRGELRVEPQIFFNQLKNIKTRIYSKT